MRFLIVGGSGFLGGELARRCSAAKHEVAATYLTRSGEAAGVEWLPLDVRRREDVDALISAFRPEVVINAAYRQADWATTAVGAANVALAASATGRRLVHVSGDAVFSGAAIRYDETCFPDPISPYGAAKAAAETAVNAIAPTAVKPGHPRSSVTVVPRTRRWCTPCPPAGREACCSPTTCDVPYMSPTSPRRSSNLPRPSITASTMSPEAMR